MAKNRIINGNFLITSKDEMTQRGINQLDIILVSGDAYVDHPTFALSLLGRLLESRGFSVGIIARPDPKNPDAMKILGQPRMFFGVSAGAMDSMVANYTPLRKRRSDDPYAPGGKAGDRPDRALTVYCNLIRQAYGKSVYIVAGGIEASLRKFAHYDFWSDSVRRPILMDCGADLLVFGMGEKPVVELAEKFSAIVKNEDSFRRLQKGKRIWDAAEILEEVRGIKGTCYKTAKSSEPPSGGIRLQSFENVAEDKKEYARTHNKMETCRNNLLWQDCSGMRIVCNEPSECLTEHELDQVYALPFTRNYHPMYKQKIPALEQVRFSVVSHRGCFGGCAFCAIGAHQGKIIQSRSEESVLEEVRRIASHPDFKGTIADLGGPTANMYGLKCNRETPCSRPSCLWPDICKNLETGQGKYLRLLKKAKSNPKVKHLFVTSGIRMDLALKSKALLKALAFEHTSGQMKVAPEHITPKVMQYMRKSMREEFSEFLKEHARLSEEAGKKQYVLPYLMAAHPGCEMEDMIELAVFLRKNNIRAEQCQIFTPTPATAATTMYYSGYDPKTLEPVFVERDEERKKLQKALILYHLPENHQEIRTALKLCNRDDLAAFLLSATKKSANRPNKKRRFKKN